MGFFGTLTGATQSNTIRAAADQAAAYVNTGFNTGNSNIKTGYRSGQSTLLSGRKNAIGSLGTAYNRNVGATNTGYGNANNALTSSYGQQTAALNQGYGQAANAIGSGMGQQNTALNASRDYLQPYYQQGTRANTLYGDAIGLNEGQQRGPSSALSRSDPRFQIPYVGDDGKTHNRFNGFEWGEAVKAEQRARPSTPGTSNRQQAQDTYFNDPTFQRISELNNKQLFNRYNAAGMGDSGAARAAIDQTALQGYNGWLDRLNQQGQQGFQAGGQLSQTEQQRAQAYGQSGQQIANVFSNQGQALNSAAQNYGQNVAGNYANQGNNLGQAATWLGANRANTQTGFSNNLSSNYINQGNAIGQNEIDRGHLLAGNAINEGNALASAKSQGLQNIIGLGGSIFKGLTGPINPSSILGRI